MKNKDSRLKDIGGLVSSVLRKQRVPISIIETLKGRLLYASGHTFGKCTQLAIQLISKAAKSGPMVVIDDGIRKVLMSALHMLLSSGPRKVTSWTGKPPVLMFTDGACEDEGSLVTHGAVLVDFHFLKFLYFGDHVPTTWVRKWRASGKKQLIGQAEIFPILVAKRTWQSLLELRPVLWFVDNSSAQSALVRSFSSVFDNYELLVTNAILDVRLQSSNWYSRVPSKSNPGDDPSRLEFDELNRKGYTRCEPCYSLPEGGEEKGLEGVKG